MIETLKPPFETPYISFSQNPSKISLEGHQVFNYIGPDTMNSLINNLCRKFDLNTFDAVLVNMKGGEFLFNEIIKRKKRYGAPKRVKQIEYHRPENGFGAIIQIPVPEDLYGKKVLVCDDIYDSGGVIREINKNLSPDSQSVFIVKKRGINNQIPIKKATVAVEIDNVWVGGCGMNLETEGDGLPEDFSRNHPGIIAKIL